MSFGRTAHRTHLGQCGPSPLPRAWHSVDSTTVDGPRPTDTRRIASSAARFSAGLSSPSGQSSNCWMIYTVKQNCSCTCNDKLSFPEHFHNHGFISISQSYTWDTTIQIIPQWDEIQQKLQQDPLCQMVIYWYMYFSTWGTLFCFSGKKFQWS